MTVVGALSSFRELGEMTPHKRACRERSIGCEQPTSMIGLFQEGKSSPDALGRSAGTNSF
jgi:hypothetical protein